MFAVCTWRTPGGGASFLRRPSVFGEVGPGGVIVPLKSVFGKVGPGVEADAFDVIMAVVSRDSEKVVKDN